MQKPPIPRNESARISSLNKLHILDTDPEEKFDLITRLTAQIFEVPTSLISLVDTERQWFKSKHGLEMDETSRDVSFCAHAIARSITDENDQLIFEVQDATKDDRFKDNLLVTNKPNICFYAGFILQSHEGYKLGTLCIIDTKPRKLSGFEKETFFNLGMIAQTELQSYRPRDSAFKTKNYICTREE